MRGELARTRRLDARTYGRDNRDIVMQARRDQSELTCAKLRVRGAMEFAEDIMAEAVELDRTRRLLARGDEAISMMLAEFQITANQQARKLQRGLFNGIELD